MLIIPDLDFMWERHPEKLVELKNLLAGFSCMWVFFLTVFCGILKKASNGQIRSKVFAKENFL